MEGNRWHSQKSVGSSNIRRAQFVSPLHYAPIPYRPCMLDRRASPAFVPDSFPEEIGSIQLFSHLAFSSLFFVWEFVGWVYWGGVVVFLAVV